MKATALGGVALSIGGDHVPPNPHHSESILIKNRKPFSSKSVIPGWRPIP
jgi:hypothetical protein